MSKVEKQIIEKEFETIRDKVLYVLEIDEESRNFDNRLYAKYLTEFTEYRIICLDDINLLISNLEDDILNSPNVKSITKASLKSLKYKLSKTPSKFDFPNVHTITRVRQLIQNQEELFLPTSQEIAEKRNVRAELIREYFIEKNQNEED